MSVSDTNYLTSVTELPVRIGKEAGLAPRASLGVMAKWDVIYLLGIEPPLPVSSQ